MSEISFYQVGQGTVEKCAAILLEKMVEQHMRVLVLTESESYTEFLNTYLWTFRPNSFVPHGTVKEGEPKSQPIWITETLDNAHHANTLMILGGQEITDLTDFSRCVDLFNGQDNTALDLARSRWKAYKKAGHTLTFWRQAEDGKWAKQD